MNLTWDDLLPEVQNSILKDFQEPLHELDDEFMQSFFSQNKNVKTTYAPDNLIAKRKKISPPKINKIRAH